MKGVPLDHPSQSRVPREHRSGLERAKRSAPTRQQTAPHYETANAARGRGRAARPRFETPRGHVQAANAPRIADDSPAPGNQVPGTQQGGAGGPGGSGARCTGPWAGWMHRPNGRSRSHFCHTPPSPPSLLSAVQCCFLCSSLCAFGGRVSLVGGEVVLRHALPLHPPHVPVLPGDAVRDPRLASARLSSHRTGSRRALPRARRREYGRTRGGSDDAGATRRGTRRPPCGLRSRPPSTPPQQCAQGDRDEGT